MAWSRCSARLGIALALMATPPVGARVARAAPSLRGLVAADGYTASYSGGELTDSAVGLDVDVAAERLGLEHLSLVADARVRQFLEGGDLTDPEALSYRVDELWLSLTPPGSFELRLGRRWVPEVEGASVDGVEAGVQIGDFRIGAFGGLEPDPYDRGFDGAYTTYGGYGRYESDPVGLGAGFVTSLFEGEMDRQSATADLRLGRPGGTVLVSAGTRVDLGGDAGTRLGAVRLFGDWRPDRRWSVGLRYDLYRYLLRDASLDPELRAAFEDVLRQSLEGRLRHRWTGGWSLDGRVVYRRRRALDGYEVRLLEEGGVPDEGVAGGIYVDAEGREYVLVADTQEEDAFGGGLSLAGPPPFDLPMSWRVGYTLATGFGRNDHELSADLRFDLGTSVELGVAGGVARRDWDVADADLGGFAQLSLLWMATRDLFALASYDGRLADGELDHALFLRVGYRLRPAAAEGLW